MPLYALGTKRLQETRIDLQEVFKKAIVERREVLLRKLEILKRHEKGIELSDIIAAR